jgi:trk system potassium uptake protein
MSFRPAVKPLLQPVRPAMVLHHLGQLALILAVLFLVPLAFAVATGDSELARRILLTALLPALVLGACARIRPSARPLQANEALVVTALTFVIAAALMTYPLTAEGLSPLDAWFESVSGVTTTGLSLVPSPELHSDAFLFTRAWMQWFGGLGIVVLSLALAFGRTEDMRRLADAGADEDSLAQGTRIHARRAFAIYVLLTAVGLILVLPTDLPPSTPSFIRWPPSRPAGSAGSQTVWPASVEALISHSWPYRCSAPYRSFCITGPGGPVPRPCTPIPSFGRWSSLSSW